MVLLCFQYGGIVLCLYNVERIENRKSCHCGGRIFIMSLGMLSGPGAFPLVSLLHMIVDFSSKLFTYVCVRWASFFKYNSLLSVPWVFTDAHVHVLGWSMTSSHSGACLWNDFCWVWYISLAMSMGLVMTLPYGVL